MELSEQVRWCWNRWHQEKTLVILDDVKNYSHIKPYLPPQSSQFKVLITTRLKLDLADSVFLEVLPESDALQLLTQLVGEEKVIEESTKAKELIQRLGYLPLALQLVGQYVKKRRISLAEMLQRLEEKGLGHPSLIVNENDPIWTRNIKRGVAAAFELSWEELSEPSQQLGCLLSLFALAPIPWSLVESVALRDWHKRKAPTLQTLLSGFNWVIGTLFERKSPAPDREAIESARVELEKLHLLQGGDTYQLHQLIREFLRNKQKNLAAADEQKYSFCQAIVKVAKEIPQIPNPKEITTLTPVIPHLAEITQNLTDAISDENLIWAFEGLRRFYSGQGLYALVEPWYKQCVSVVQSRLGKVHPNVATSYNNLAGIYESLGRYTEAEALYVKALELMQRLLGEEHPNVATNYNNLAGLYESLGRYTEAELMYVRALELRQHLLGEKHPNVATSYNNLAALYESLGRYTESELMYVKALKIVEFSLGVDHPNTITIRENLKYLRDNHQS